MWISLYEHSDKENWHKEQSDTKKRDFLNNPCTKYTKFFFLIN